LQFTWLLCLLTIPSSLSGRWWLTNPNLVYQFLIFSFLRQLEIGLRSLLTFRTKQSILPLTCMNTHLEYPSINLFNRDLLGSTRQQFFISSLDLFLFHSRGLWLLKTPVEPRNRPYIYRSPIHRQIQANHRSLLLSHLLVLFRWLPMLVLIFLKLWKLLIIWTYLIFMIWGQHFHFQIVVELTQLYFMVGTNLLSWLSCHIFFVVTS